jgi:hypothetical protein
MLFASVDTYEGRSVDNIVSHRRKSHGGTSFSSLSESDGVLWTLAYDVSKGATRPPT